MNPKAFLGMLGALMIVTLAVASYPAMTGSPYTPSTSPDPTAAGYVYGPPSVDTLPAPVAYAEAVRRVGFHLPKATVGEVSDLRFRGVSVWPGGSGAIMIYSPKPLSDNPTKTEVYESEGILIKLTRAKLPASQLCDTLERILNQTGDTVECLSVGGVEVASMGDGLFLNFIFRGVDIRIISEAPTDLLSVAERIIEQA